MSRHCRYLFAAVVCFALPAHAQECFQYSTPHDFHELMKCVEQNTNDLREVKATVEQVSQDVSLIGKRLDAKDRSQELRDKYDMGKWAFQVACQNREVLLKLRTQLKMAEDIELKELNCTSE